MSSGPKHLIAGMAVFALTITSWGNLTVHAQESSGTSLSERLSLFGRAFKRGDSRAPQTARRTSGGRPTYSSTSRLSTTTSNSRSNSSSRTSITDVLTGSWFGRKKSTAESNQQQQGGAISYVPPEPPPFIVEGQANPPAQVQAKTVVRPKAEVAAPSSIATRAGSVARSPRVRTHARKSPQATREEDLDETLADLMENEAVMTMPAEPEVELAADQSASQATPPLAEEPIQVAQKTPAKVHKQREKPVELSDALVALAAEESAPSEAKKPAKKPAGKPAAAKSVATKRPVASARIDLHDALLSGELYEDLTASEPEESEPISSKLAEQEVTEEDDEPWQQTDSFAKARKAVPMPPNPRAEEHVAEVTSLPFENMEEDYLESSPRIRSTPREFRVQPERRRDDVVDSRQHRSEPLPVSRLRKPAGDVLTTTEQPVIVSHVEGPRSILVGREASYRVILENTSDFAAQNLSASIQVPEWADLVDVVSTSGEVARGEGDSDTGELEWRLPDLAAHTSQTLRLRLIPRSGREFQLGVQWSQESSTAGARVQVKEPKLEMSIHGPQEVLFGAPQRYRLTLYNPGTGSAERVAVSLIPPGKDSTSAATHAIGTLGPEEVKEIEMELTAREAGELILQASASAAGGLQADAIKRVLCRKPVLEVDWRGPDHQFAGTETAYYFRVQNPGTAATDPVEVKVHLPEGIRFLSASDSYSVDAVTGVVTWRLSSLTPGEVQYMQVRCQLDRPGVKEFDVTARTVDGDLHDTKSIRTEVVALADLKLEVNDPQGARPVGETVVYEIRVANRGTTDARGVSIIGLFSEGIEPVSVEGAQNSVRDGRVTFHPVKSLPAGGEVLLRIRAVASEVGTHVFRAEVSCEDLDIKLASEETTRFFQDEFQWKEGETPYTAERTSDSISR